MLQYPAAQTDRRALYQLLSSVVAPRPIAFASTVGADGSRNLAPFSFFNLVGSNPPMLMFAPNRSGRTGQEKHTLSNLRAVPEVVINLVSYNMVYQMDIAGLEYPAQVDEFVKSGFTPLPSVLVRPARVAESAVQIECLVRQLIDTGTEGGAGTLVLAEVQMVHVQPDVLDDHERIDPYRLDLVGRLGADYYVRVRAGLFELPKTAERLGIGFDLLPAGALASHILSGNDLARMARLDTLPNPQQVAQQIHNLAESPHNPAQVHQQAKRLIQNGQAFEALALLMAHQSFG